MPPANTTEQTPVKSVAPEIDSPSAVKLTKQSNSLSVILSKSTITENHEPEKEYVRSYIYAFLSAIFFGLANFFASLIAKLSINALWSYWAGCLGTFILYHLTCYIQNYREGKIALFSVEGSMYYVRIEPEK